MNTLASRLSVILTLTSVVCGCSHNNDNAVPRRIAYPRIQAYDSIFVPLSDMPVNLMINNGVDTSMVTKDDGTVWLNLTYDRYNATVYCTITPVDNTTVEAVLDNRSERIYRNLGSANPTVEDIYGQSGFVANLITDYTVSTTPVQFIAYNTNNPKWVISGSTFFDNASSITSADSIRPMVESIRRDMYVMLSSLSDK